MQKLTCRAIVQAYPHDPLLMHLFYDAVLAACVLRGGRHCRTCVTKLVRVDGGQGCELFEGRSIESV